MAGIPKGPERRRKPEPCKQCGADVWKVYMGSCDDCHAKVYAEFVKAMGWDIEQAQVQQPEKPGKRVQVRRTKP